MLQEALTKLSPTIRGSVISPTSDEYESARKVYNGMIDRLPDVIVRCANVADVRTSVNFAREENLTVAVRGGGHSGPGLGVCDHGLVIDLSLMKGVRVDPVTNTVRAEAGCAQADLNMRLIALAWLSRSESFPPLGAPGSPWVGERAT